jgi:hypothetical protein
MTLPQYRDLAAYWRHCPPAHLILLALCGAKAPAAGGADLGSLMAALGRT